MKDMFDLQLFAEEGEAGGAPAPAAAPAAAPTPAAAPAPTAPTAATAATAPATAPAATVSDGAPAAPATPETKPAPAVGIVVDPDTGRRKLVFNDSPAQGPEGSGIQPAEPQQVQQQNQQAQQPPAPQPYTADELFRDIAMGREVDEARVPQELEGHYAAIKQQRVNAAQQQAQATQAQQQAVQQQEQQQEQQVTPEQAAQAQLAVYSEIQTMAQQKAAQDLNITPEQLEEAKYSDDKALQQKVEAYNMAVRMNVDEIKQTLIANRMQQQQQEQARQMEIKQQLDTILPKWQEYQKDPHYNEIDTMMGDMYKTMPYEEGAKIAQAINRIQNKQPVKGDFDSLNEYYLKTREAYYAKQTGVGTTPQPAPAQAKPPVVEKPGSGAPAPAAPVNWGSMRTMTPLQRSQFLQSQFRR